MHQSLLLFELNRLKKQLMTQLEFRVMIVLILKEKLSSPKRSELRIESLAKAIESAVKVKAIGKQEYKGIV